jgi:TonB family protein
MTDTILLNTLWQGALVVSIAALMSRFVPQPQAATRYAVWFASLIALAILPVLTTLWQPMPSVPVVPTIVVHTATATTRATQQAANAGGTWLAALWLAGVIACLGRLVTSGLSIGKIVRNATPALDLGEGVMLSDQVTIPLAARVFSPVILLPSHVATSLERADLDDIIAHERAHLERGDIVGNVLQRLIEAALFFNPWVYVIGRQLIKEREAACDDRAVQGTNRAHRYAASLAQLAQHARRSRAPLLTPSALGSKHVLVGRIARLLNGKAAEVKVNYFIVGSSVAAFAALAVLLQTSNGLASVTNAAVATSCTTPDADATVTDPVEWKIPKSALHGVMSAKVLVTVAPDGSVANEKVIESSGNAVFDRATMDAARQSVYAPKVVACKKVTGHYVFRVQAKP